MLDIRALIAESAESATVRFRVVDGKGTTATCAAKVSPVNIQDTIDDREALSRAVWGAETVKLSVKLAGKEATATVVAVASGPSVSELIYAPEVKAQKNGVAAAK